MIKVRFNESDVQVWNNKKIFLGGSIIPTGDPHLESEAVFIGDREKERSGFSKNLQYNKRQCI